MILGTHTVVVSSDAEADRAFVRDVLELDHVELSLMTDDIEAQLAALRSRGAQVADEVQDEGWGIVGQVTLPGGGALAIHQPRHETAHPRTPA